MSVDKFEQKLREKFEAVSIPPSPELWGNIQSRIPQKEKKRGIIWFWAAGVSIAASLLVWLWLSNAAIQPQIEIDNTLSNTEDTNLPIQEEGSSLEAVAPNNLSLTDNEAAVPSNDKNNRPQLSTTPDFVERAAVRTPDTERSAPQNEQTAVITNNVVEQNGGNTAKTYALKTIDRWIDEEPIIANPNPKDGCLDGWCVILTFQKDTWWDELPEEDESVPRWAVNIQAGQDLIGDVNGPFKNEPMLNLSTNKASNTAELSNADYVQYTRNPNIGLSENEVDQATLISYPTQESRVKIVGEYRLTGNWSLRSGLGFGLSNQGELTQANVVYNSIPSPTSVAEGAWSYDQGPSLQNIQLEVPLTLQYRINKAKGAFVLGSGFSFNRNLNNLSQARYNRDGFTASRDAQAVFSVSDQANVVGLSDASQSLAYRSWNSFVLLQA
ncbi:MAG: hypothetical protein AB8H47_11880, partial [Bacteroidia bacterium]